MTEDNPSRDAVLGHLNAHYRPDVATDLLAAAQPLMAIAWDEGVQAQKAWTWNDDMEPLRNPYRKEPNQ